MVLQARCECGKQVRVNDDQAGKTVHCLRCRRPIPIPRAAEPEPVARPEAAVEPAAGAASVRDSLYWVFPLAFLPLAIMLGRPEPPGLKERFDRTLSHQSPGVRERVEDLMTSDDATLDGLLNLLPDKKLDDAYLPRTTGMHWLFAAMSAGAFWCLVGSCFAPGSAAPRDLLCVGLFTGTIGVALLLTAHQIRPIAAFIDFCHVSAADPRSEFLVVFSGFTFGVGLVEEVCKLVPILWYYRRFHALTWRMACLWGLASGAGFGIAEGVLYATSFYNGISPPGDYVVRFLSCVALHAIWTASAALSLHRNHDLFQELRRSAGQPMMYRDEHTRDEEMQSLGQYLLVYSFVVLRVIAAVMFLHGLYDAALTRQKYLLALVVAIASFAWLAWQIEERRRAEQPVPAPTEAATS